MPNRMAINMAVLAWLTLAIVVGLRYKAELGMAPEQPNSKPSITAQSPDRKIDPIAPPHKRQLKNTRKARNTRKLEKPAQQEQPEPVPETDNDVDKDGIPDDLS